MNLAFEFLYNIFKKKKEEKPKYVITESIHGNWFYHISRSDKLSKSLCGKETMYSGSTFDQWGTSADHIPEKWCEECKKIMENEND